jgi:hypothetical protein
MRKLVLVLVVVALLLFVGCEPNQPKVPPRHEPIPDNYVPPVEENITPTEPEEVVPPVEEDVVEPEPEEVISPTEPEDITPPSNPLENLTIPTVPAENITPIPDVLSENITLPIPASENLTEPYVYSKDTFFTDVIVDLESFNPSVGKIEEVMEIASFKFKQLTGYNLELRGLYYLSEISGTEDTSGGYLDAIQYKHFLNKNQGLNGVIVFTKEFNTESQGGHSTAYYYPDYCNSFKSVWYNYPAVYFSYQDWEHQYSTCGYDYENDQHVSSVSIGGECGNQPGTQCIFNGDYYICDYAQEDYYAEENVFVACTIVHEFMHPFGENGNYDHYGTAICNEAMGTTAADSSSEDFQYYCGLCPNVYENFKNSFVDC